MDPDKPIKAVKAFLISPSDILLQKRDLRQILLNPLKEIQNNLVAIDRQVHGKQAPSQSHLERLSSSFEKWFCERLLESILGERRVVGAGWDSAEEFDEVEAVPDCRLDQHFFNHLVFVKFKYRVIAEKHEVEELSEFLIAFNLVDLAQSS